MIKSNIQISGNIVLTIHTPQNGFKLCSNDEVIVSISRLNKSQSAVYEIRNKFNPERFYIGQTRNLHNRHLRHIRDLIANQHICSKLQDDWNLFKQQNNFDPNLHPSELFEFAVIIYCRPSELTFYENILIRNLNPFYNIHKQKGSENE